jgi:hypothetical protein
VSPRSVPRPSFGPVPTRNAASFATPRIAPEARNVAANDGFEESAVAIPILFSARRRPPARLTAASPAAE